MFGRVLFGKVMKESKSFKRKVVFGKGVKLRFEALSRDTNGSWLCFLFGKGSVPSGAERRVWTLSVTHTCGDAKGKEQ